MAIKTDNMIFVFGSNLGGIHGSGAARFAMQHRDAKFGVGYGRTGQSYAIPTKGISHGRVGATLQLMTIRRFVTDFLQYARERQEHQFQVTCIGCGLAGLKNEEIAPMFARIQSREFDPMDNVWFDQAWEQHLGPKYNYWGTF